MWNNLEFEEEMFMEFASDKGLCREFHKAFWVLDKKTKKYQCSKCGFHFDKRKINGIRRSN